jgi:hypothetical protein
MRKKDAG